MKKGKILKIDIRLKKKKVYTSWELNSVRGWLITQQDLSEAAPGDKMESMRRASRWQHEIAEKHKPLKLWIGFFPSSF